jgi:hypothetical protein
VATSDCADDSSQACRLAEVLGFLDNGLTAGRLGALRVLGAVVVVVVAGRGTTCAAVGSTIVVVVVIVVATVH